jgi:hypothetical protein
MVCILISTMTKLYQKLAKESNALNEYNDCAVKAIAIVCNIKYKEAWSLAKKFGRRPRGRTNSLNVTYPAIKSKGFDCTQLENHKMNKAKTIRGLKALIPSRGVFLVFVRGHILAVRGGEIHDWTEDRCHRIQLIVRVSKKA